MKIPFSDDIWGRLYGPYGNETVSKQLGLLSENWDDAIARDLFYEKLHHQDDIYPVTFAALPWLLDMVPATGEPIRETKRFLSHVIYCAISEGGTGCDGTGPRGRYRGLSTKILDHRHEWIPQHEWLLEDDRPALVGLEKWFSKNCREIAESCLDLVGVDLWESAHAIEGFATIHGGERVAWTVNMVADGEQVDVIVKQVGQYDEQDSKVVELLYSYIEKRNSDLMDFMLAYPGCCYVPDDPRQNGLI